MYPAGHEVQGQRIVVGQSINLPKATGRTALDQPVWGTKRPGGRHCPKFTDVLGIKFDAVPTLAYIRWGVQVQAAYEVLTPDSFLFPIDDGKGGLYCRMKI